VAIVDEAGQNKRPLENLAIGPTLQHVLGHQAQQAASIVEVLQYF